MARAKVTVRPADCGPIQLDKRQHIPFEIRAKCPTCGGTATLDLSSDYLSYPEIGEPTEVALYCYDEDGCETCRTDITVVIGFTLTVSGAPRKGEI